MSILSGFFKTKKYRKTDTGYQLQSEWTSASTVEMADGNTAETNLGAIQGITDSLTATSSNVALSAKAGSNLQGQIDELNSNLNKKLFYPNFANRLRQYNGTAFEYTINSSGVFLIAKITNTDNAKYQAAITIDGVEVGQASKGETSWISFPVAPGSTIKSKSLSNVNYDIYVYALKY